MSEGATPGNSSTLTGSGAIADLAPGTRLANRFTIERRVGTGGMGVVYRARDEDLGVTVALKLLRGELAARPEAFERFRQELLLARQVSSPRVVRIHDIARDGDRWFISMDFVDGQSLDHWLDHHGQVDVDQALAITRQIAEGLQAAHASGIVHRDLKPGNILLDGEGHALITDFGVARSLGSTGLTQTGAIVGTPDYLAPEQARGDAVDARSDLYALGLILYEMLAGEPAFAGATAAESMARRMVASPPGIETRRADLPGWVARLLARLLRPNPAHRPRDAASVIQAIDARHVPAIVPRWTWPVFGLAAAAGLTTLVLLAPWREPAPVMPAAPPRIVLFAEAGAGDAALEGAAEALRLGLAGRPGIAVADGERIRLALAQSRLAGRGVANDEALGQALPAARFVRLHSVSADEGVAFEAVISGRGLASPRVVVGPSRASPAAAARDLLEPLAIALDAPHATSILAGDEDLEAYGLALRLLQAGRADEAADALVRITDLDRNHAPALAALVNAARIAGRRALAVDAARRADGLPGQPLAFQLAAWRMALEGDTEKAIALASAPGLAGDPGLQLQIAEIALDGGDLEVAESSLAIAAANDPQDPRVWYLRGKTAILRGDLRVAVEDHLVRALVLFKRSRDLRGEAETVNALGVGYARLGQTGDAEKQYEEALQLRRELGDRRGTASSLRNLAQIDLFRGRHDQAATRLDEARGLFQVLGDDAGLAAVENELGLLEEERGDYQAALAAYRRGLRSREQGGDPLGMAESLNNLGFAHFQLGDYDNARALWQQARDAFAGLEDTNGVVRVEQNLGLLETARGDWTRARELLEASLGTAEQRQMLEEAAVSLRNLVELEIIQGRLDQADQRLDRARRLFESREDQRGRTDAALLAAKIALARGKPAEALGLIEDLPGGAEAATPEQAAIAALLRARALADEGRGEDLRQALATADEAAIRAGIRSLQLEARVLAAPGPDAALDDEVRQLGNLPLQLAWLERSGTLALAAQDLPGARAALREARELLAGGRPYVRRTKLEALARQVDAEARGTP